MLTRERIRLILSIISAEGLWRTSFERLQWARPAGDLVEPGRSAKRLPGIPQHNDYVGVAHIHSTYSDGTATVPQIAAAGADAGLDFILVADHNTVIARLNGEERWYCGNKVLVAVGSEITTSEGHLLAFDTPETFFPAPHDAREAMQGIHQSGGYGFIALPCDLKGHWGDFNVREPGIGIEVFNLSAIARTKINLPGFLLALLRYRGDNPITAFSYIAARPDREIKVWDGLLEGASRRGEKLPHAIGCLDAHAVMRIAGREYFYPTYEEVFRTLRTHILTKEILSNANDTIERDLAILHDALRNGRSYISYDNFGDPRGFLVELRHNGEYIGTTGRCYEIPPGAQGEYRLAIRAPRTRTIIRVFRNGRQIVARRGGVLDYPITEAGVYRVEVQIYRRRVGNLCIGARPWIFSNALQVKIVQSAVTSTGARNQASVQE